jgi:hypothetical protein
MVKRKGWSYGKRSRCPECKRLHMGVKGKSCKQCVAREMWQPMTKRTCPKCGTDWYSADASGIWLCECGAILPPEVLGGVSLDQSGEATGTRKV